jgi:uncharacterized protein YegL
MKTIRSFVATAFVFCWLVQPVFCAEAPRAYFVGVSPYLEKTEREAVFKHFSLLVLEVLRTGETAEVYDVYSLKPVTSFTIPVGPQFEKNPNARAIRLKNEFASLRRFFTNETSHAEQPEAIKFPQFLALVSSHLRSPGQVCEIILIGSPFYVDSREKMFNMVQARFPSDAVILSDLKVSPFGTAEKRHALTNTFVHFSYLRDCFTNDLHRDRVERFISLFIRQQNGVAVSFASDPAVVFGRIRRNAHDAFRSDVIDLTDRKPRMLSAAGDRVVEVQDLAQDASTSRNSVPAEIATQLQRWNKKIEDAAGRQDWLELVSRIKAAQDDVPAIFRPKAWCDLLVEALVHSADSLNNRSGKRARLEEAVFASKTCGCDSTVPSLKLSLLDAEETADSRETRARASAEFESLLRAGDDISGLEQKLTLYLRADAVAKTNGLPLAPATLRITSTQAKLAEVREAELRRNRPTDLPHGSKARVTRVTKANFPPFIGLDLWIENGRGEPVRGLEAKDFQITCDGRPVRSVQLASINRQPPPVNVVLALDCSGSMRGKALTAAIQAAKDMLISLANDLRVSVQVLAFSDDVRCIQGWTTDKMSAVASIDRIKASGETALFAAINSATDSLSHRDGERRLVLFTDGRNTSTWRGSDPMGLSRELHASGAECFAIGLHGTDLDTRTLRQIADHYIEAADAGQLKDAFKTTGENLRREVYRFVFAPDLSADGFNGTKLKLNVGSGNSVTVDHDVEIPINVDLSEKSR